MTIWDQPPGTYAAKAATPAFFVGPHNRLHRNGIVFNDRSQLECFWVEDFSGFQSPGLRAGEVENSQESGATPTPALHGSRPMTMTGWIQAGTYTTLINMQRALMDSLLDLVQMDMTVGVAPASYFTQPDVTISCRPSDVPQIGVQIQQGYLSGLLKSAFTVALTAFDPNYYGTTLKNESIAPEVVSVPGRPYDRVYDISYIDLLDLSGDLVEDGDPNVLTVQNDGNWDASVVLRATGAMANVTVVNQTTGQRMYFANVEAGDYIEVDTHPDRGSVRDQTGSLRSNLLDPRSDWMVLQGIRNGSDGSNRIVLYAESYDEDATLQVSFRDTYR